jgi:hypothetical protein
VKGYIYDFEPLTDGNFIFYENADGNRLLYFTDNNQGSTIYRFSFIS